MERKPQEPGHALSIETDSTFLRAPAIHQGARVFVNGGPGKFCARFNRYVNEGLHSEDRAYRPERFLKEGVIRSKLHACSADLFSIVT